MADNENGVKPATEIFDDKSLSDSQIAQPEADINAEQAIMWYGITSIANAFLALLFYLIFNYDGVVAGYYEIMLSQQIAYWPVSIGWAAIALLDNSFTRSLYKSVLSISVLGPFAGNIVGFIFLFLNGNGVWDLWYFWFLWPLYLCYDVGQMLIQFLFLPKIFEYLDLDMDLTV